MLTYIRALFEIIYQILIQSIRFYFLISATHLKKSDETYGFLRYLA